MAKAIRNGAKRPPLSVFDQLLYFIAGLLLFGFALFTIIYLGSILPDNLHHDSPEVLWKNSGAASVLCTMPLVVVLFVALSLVITGRKLKIPIFGNPKFKPKLFEPVIKVYPLGSPQYSENFTVKERKALRISSICIMITLCVSIFVYPMGIYPRKVYLKDGTLCTYNMLNAESHRANIAGAESFTIRSEYAGRHNLPDFIGISISVDGKNYEFDPPETKESVEYVLYIKSLFSPDQIHITVSKRTFQRMLNNSNLDTDTISLLCELCEMTP